MFDKLKLALLAHKLKRCKVTPLPRPQLNAIKLTIGDKGLRPKEYIDLVASQLPIIKVNGAVIDTAGRMRELFYRHGLPGLNLYVNYMKLRTKVEMKRKKVAKS